MKTLYVSDLDGTLLRSDETISDYTSRTINTLTGQGMLFSYATARSLVTARKVTAGLNAHIPVIVYNGAFVMDHLTGEILLSNFFGEDVREVFEYLFCRHVYPIVYAYIDGVEKFSYIEEKCTPGMRSFLESRKGDVRTHPVTTPEELTQGDCFYITCIDKPDILEPLYVKYKDAFHCVYQEDIYTKEQWLEIMPSAASKSGAAARLKQYLGYDRLIVFGDGRNDLDLFDSADESYAVDNADATLKEKATAVIGGNNEDGVAKWLAAHHQPMYVSHQKGGFVK